MHQLTIVSANAMCARPGTLVARLSRVEHISSTSERTVLYKNVIELKRCWV